MSAEATAAAVSTGLDFAGGLFQGGLNFLSQERTNRQNRDLTYQQWHRDDTAIQRRVKDLQAAGLNPALAAGSAASSGSPLAMSPPKMSGLDRAGESILKGLSVSQMNSQITKTKADTNFVNQQTANANEELKYKKQLNTKIGIENQYLADQIQMELAYKLARKENISEDAALKRIDQKIKNYDYKFHKDNFQAYNRAPGKEDTADKIIRYLAALRSGAVPDVVTDVKKGYQYLKSGFNNPKTIDLGNVYSKPFRGSGGGSW